MKRLVPAVLLLAALPLAADEAAKKETAAPAPKPASAPAVAVVDSPLVAAAKRSAKAKKPVILITNDTLSKAGTSSAHITTTNKPLAELPPLPPAPVVVQLDPNLKVVQQPKVVSTEAKKRLEEAAARAAEEGPYGDDPARAERQLDALAKQAAREAEQQKKP